MQAVAIGYHYGGEGGLQASAARALIVGHEGPSGSGASRFGVIDGVGDLIDGQSRDALRSFERAVAYIQHRACERSDIDFAELDRHLAGAYAALGLADEADHNGRSRADLRATTFGYAFGDLMRETDRQKPRGFASRSEAGDWFERNATQPSTGATDSPERAEDE